MCLCKMHEIDLEAYTRPLILREESFSVLNICLHLCIFFKAVILKWEQDGLERKAGVSSRVGFGTSLQQAGF